MSETIRIKRRRTSSAICCCETLRPPPYTATGVRSTPRNGLSRSLWFFWPDRLFRFGDADRYLGNGDVGVAGLRAADGRDGQDANGNAFPLGCDAASHNLEITRHFPIRHVPAELALFPFPCCSEMIDECVTKQRPGCF